MRGSIVRRTDRVYDELVDAQVTLLVSAHLLVTIAEEADDGATHGLDTDVAEGRRRRQRGRHRRPAVAGGSHVTMALLDSTGPFDDHCSRRLIALCEEHGVPHRRGALHYYWSDAASAVEADLDMRTAWWAPVSTPRAATSAPPGRHPARHGTAGALPADLTFPRLNTSERGLLKQITSRSVQPTSLEDLRRADG